MILAGDFVPLKTIPDVGDFGGELVLANLEGPVCSSCLPKAPKSGPNLCSDPFDIPGRWAFALANNHMMDYGHEGLSETLNFLAEHKYLYAGAGDGIDTARRPMTVIENGKRIDIFSCCEKQFGIAGYTRAGVAEKGLWLFDAISSAKKNGADYIIVSSHVASEMSPFVSPSIVAFYHSLIDAGADVIHGHHSHVPQGFERYHDKLITYGLGNFVVDSGWGWARHPDFLWSLIAKLDFSGESITWKIMPYGRVPDYASCYIDAVNRGFSDSRLLEGIWQTVCMRLYDYTYKDGIYGARLKVRDVLSRVKRTILRQPLPSRRAVVEQKRRAKWQLFGCESHRDAIEVALGIMTGAIEDLRTDESMRLVDKFFMIGRK